MGRTELGSWSPISIVDRDIRLHFGVADVRLTLSREPTANWIRAFRFAPATRVGSPEFVSSSIRPFVAESVILWSVPPADLDGAWEFVKQCLQRANDVCQLAGVDAPGGSADSGDPLDEEVLLNAELRRRLNELE